MTVPEQADDAAAQDFPILTGPEVVAIAAVAANGVIGADGDIPWRIAADWARFKRLTLGHVLVMGRKTYESIGRPLPGRSTMVVTRDPSWSGPGVETALTVPDALVRARQLGGERPVYVAGGAEIYRAAWPETTVLELTEVDQTPDGDTVFPEVDPGEWHIENRDDRDGYAFTRYRRVAGAVPRSTVAATPGV